MSKQIKTILIPNATGPTNIGDQAMLEVLVKLLYESYPQAKLILHSSDVALYKKVPSYVLKNALYHEVAFADTRFISRLRKLVTLFWYLMKIAVFNTPPIKKDLDTSLSGIVSDYFKADMIVFVGGGYLRSQTGLTQIINATMQLVHLLLAQKSKAITIVAPISFGPYAQGWLEALSAQVLLRCDLVSLREEFSYNKLKDRKSKSVILSSDHALLLDKASSQKKGTFRIGVTLRQWLSPKKQKDFENNVYSAIKKFARTHSIEVLPIVQVHGEKYGTQDKSICLKLREKLLANGIRVLPIKTVTTVSEGKKIYSSLDMLLGMRMHSNIIAATQGIPFVAISYEYKTEGIATQLGLKDYVIKIEDVTSTRLEKLLEKGYSNRTTIKSKMNSNLQLIQTEQKRLWTTIFKQFKTVI